LQQVRQVRRRRPRNVIRSGGDSFTTATAAPVRRFFIDFHGVVRERDVRLSRDGVTPDAA
jgi:hypothetical protein